MFELPNAPEPNIIETHPLNEEGDPFQAEEEEEVEAVVSTVSVDLDKKDAAADLEKDAVSDTSVKACVAAASREAVEIGPFSVGSFTDGTFAVGSFSVGTFSVGSFSVGSFSVETFTVGTFASGTFGSATFAGGASSVNDTAAPFDDIAEDKVCDIFSVSVNNSTFEDGMACVAGALVVARAFEVAIVLDVSGAFDVDNKDAGAFNLAVDAGGNAVDAFIFEVAMAATVAGSFLAPFKRQFPLTGFSFL